jgi:hypothetical protein
MQVAQNRNCLMDMFPFCRLMPTIGSSHFDRQAADLCDGSASENGSEDVNNDTSAIFVCRCTATRTERVRQAETHWQEARDIRRSWLGSAGAT